MSNKITVINESVGIGGNTDKVINDKSVVIGHSELPRDVRHGPSAINIGHNVNRSVGTCSIAIGAHCSTGLTQIPNNCIVISSAGTGTQVVPSTTGCCLITPIRACATGTNPSTMYYNSSNGEWMYNGIEIVNNYNGIIDSSGRYSTTQLGTTGSFTINNGTTNQQFKTIYASSMTPTINYGTIGYGTNSQINAFALDEKRQILYMGGMFSVANGNPNKLIVGYNLGTKTWVSLGSGLFGSVVYALIIDSDRDMLYIGGSFSSANGVANSCIARFNLATNSWAPPMGSGMETIIQAFAIDKTRGVLYIGGSFVKANNVTNNRIARFNLLTDTWGSPMDAGIDGTSVNALAMDETRGILYLGGWITAANNDTTNNYIARYNVINSTWGPPMDAGLSGAVLAFTIDKTYNTLYIGGTFNLANNNTNNNIARYDLINNQWGTPLSAGVYGAVRGISIDTTRNIMYVVGAFSSVDNVSYSCVGRYDLTKNMWLSMKCCGVGMNNIVFAVLYVPFVDSVYFGGSFTSTNNMTTSNISYLQLPTTRLLGSFWYNFKPYSLLDMDTNAVVTCMYMSHIASWAIVSCSGVNNIIPN